MANKSDILSGITSGVMLVLGFPPFDYYPLAWIALVPLLFALRDKNLKTSFYLGLLTGFVYFAGTIYWIYHSMYYYGGLPLVLSVLFLMILSLYMALYTGVFSLLFNFLIKDSSFPAVLIVPVLWVTLEFLRSYALTGFPWSTLGYSQYRFLPLIQAADITGVYGVSFLVSAMSGAMFDAAVYRSKMKNEKPPFSRLPLVFGIIIYTVIIASSLFYGMEKIKEDDEGQKIKISVVQGNIEQDKKWDSRFQREVIDTYKRLSVKVASDNPDIIVWPESALPFIYGYDKILTGEITSFQKHLGSYLLFGSVLVKKDDANDTRLSNSAVLLSPDRDNISVYDKIHLVPYGEYVPMSTVFPFIEKMVTAIGDFIPGQETTVMETPFARIGNLICYEIIFPGLVRKFADSGANLLVTITNDAWFGRTAAPYQHFSMAVFRAVENRVPVARAANTGISGFIDSRGRIKAESDIFVEAALTEEIALGNERSFYTSYGDLFAYFCILCSAFLIMSRLLTEGRRKVG